MKRQVWVVILGCVLVGVVTQGTTGAQTPLAETRQRADQGEAIAQSTLGVMYENGWGVPQDNVEAYKWSDLATSRVTGDTQKEYAQTRDAQAKQMTPAQLAEAQRRAADWQATFEKR